MKRFKSQIKNNILFFKNFLVNPGSIGSVIPSSRFLSRQITSKISHSDKPIVVVELGSGTGVFSQDIINVLKEDDLLFIIEINKHFYTSLKKKFDLNNNVIIIKDSACNIDNILLEHDISKVDFIISGIPFSSLPKQVTYKILLKCKKIMHDDSILSLFQYSKVFSKLFEKIFMIKTSYVFRNFPSAFVFHCSLKK